MKRCDIPIIRDENLSGPCIKPKGLPVLELIHRTLPARTKPAGDVDVLQDEFGAAILDEVTGNQIYDDLKQR
jgi:hypothetical protein